MKSHTGFVTKFGRLYYMTLSLLFNSSIDTFSSGSGKINIFSRDIVI